ncbi:MAG: F0F1 ATP synthase subunit epsilon [Clostridia bacterium]|nr:F0F1 ATP synthase subunit epsilon [Clostridia bacterium]
MKEFGLAILTPIGQAFAGDVKSVNLRATDGEVGILAGHTDYLAGVDVCVVKLIDAEDNTRYAFCGGGFFSMTAGEATLVADEFVFADELDGQTVANELAELSARMSAATDPQTKQFLKLRTARAEAKRKAVAAQQER